MNGFDYHRYVCLPMNLMNVEMYCEKISMESGKMMVEN